MDSGGAHRSHSDDASLSSSALAAGAVSSSALAAGAAGAPSAQKPPTPPLAGLSSVTSTRTTAALDGGNNITDSGGAHRSHSDDASLSSSALAAGAAGAPPRGKDGEKQPHPQFDGPSPLTSSATAHVPSTAAASSEAHNNPPPPPNQQSGAAAGLVGPATVFSWNASNFLHSFVGPHFVKDWNGNSPPSVLPFKCAGLAEKITTLQQILIDGDGACPLDIQEASTDIIKFINLQYAGEGNLLKEFAPYLPPTFEVDRTLDGLVFVGPGLPDVKAAIEERKAVEKREKDKIRQRRRRLKLAHKQLQDLANGKKTHVPQPMKYVASDVVLDKDLKYYNNLLEYRKGWQMTKVANLPKTLPALKAPMDNAVIVRPEGEDPDARVIIHSGCIIWDKNPPSMIFKEDFQSAGTLVHQLTKGGKRGDNGVDYCLIKYQNDQVFWRPLDQVFPLVGGEDRKTRRPPVYFRPGDGASPSSKTEDDTEINHGVYVSVKNDVDSLNAVYSDSSKALVEGSCDGIIKEAVRRAVSSQQQFRSGETERKGRMANNISLLARSSLLCARITDKLPSGELPSLSEYVGDNYSEGLSSHTRLVEDASMLSYEAIISRFTNPKQSPKQQSSEQKVEKRICKRRGCKTPVHSEAYGAGYCKKHNPNPKLCNACQKSRPQKAGGLCISCYKKQNPQEDNAAPLCVICVQRVAMKKDGACSQCREKIGDRKLPCKMCRLETNRRWKKGLCYGCYQKHG